MSGTSSTRAKNKYNAKAYDRINFVMPKGYKELIKTASANAGESVNSYIRKAVDERMQRDSQ